VLVHELLHFAKANGRQLELKERLLRAYFVEGRHVGRADELADLAAEAGLDRDQAAAALADHRFLADVKADMARATAYGITGVPFYVIDGRYGVSGAQDPAIFAQALTQVAAEKAA
jgi:predicted DsbA family dithiol-disulfide isomerase